MRMGMMTNDKGHGTTDKGQRANDKDNDKALPIMMMTLT
jgi:hypothetical protein